MASLRRVHLQLILSLLLAACAVACEGGMNYVVTMRFTFAREYLNTLDDKADVPTLVAVTHTKDFSLFQVAKNLSDPVAEVVALRQTHSIEKQLKKLQRQGVVETFKIIDGPDRDGDTKLEVRAQDSATRLSLIAPLSPSPDFFTGLPGDTLCVNGAFVKKKDMRALKTYDGGLLEGDNFIQSSIPYDKENKRPISEAKNYENESFASFAIEEGTLGTDWWKIFLGVLAALAVVLLCGIFVVPRFRKKRRDQIPLTAQDGVEW